MNNHQNIPLLIGPLPPPWGGARVSFNLFYDYLNGVDLDIRYYDLPIRTDRDGNPPGSVNHTQTLKAVLSCLKFVPRAKSVAVFGSRRFCFSYGLIILLWSKMFGKKCYLRFFGGRPMLEFVSRPVIVTNLLLRILAFADVVTLETKIGAKEFPKYIQEKIKVIPGYRSRISKQPAVKKTQITRYVYVGGIISVKGLSVLADAFSDLSSNDIELHVYGTGDLKIINRLMHMKGVFYHGKVENDALRNQLPNYDAFVFPTMYSNEGHPGVLIEAFMAGLPIITTDIPGINEMVKDGDNGLIVQPGVVEPLTMAMLRLASDEKLKSSLSDGAKKASKLYDARIVLPQLMRVMGL